MAIRRLFLLTAMLAALAGLMQPASARPLSPGQANAPLQAGKMRPGQLLSYDRMALPGNYRAKAWRITYATRDVFLRPTLSTGIVVLPDKAPKIPMERRLVAWAHPTTGIARKCAPSLRSSPLKAIAGLNDLVAAGLVVSATDYPGLGTEGPMGYLVGPGQAYAAIDSVRAARQIPGVGGGLDYALFGFSQGGHAALFASQLSARYAPELKLKGVAAVAPPTDLGALLRANLDSVAGRILAAFTLGSWSVKYSASLDGLVDPRARRIIGEVGRSCVDDLGGQLDALSAQRDLEKHFFRADPARTAPWSGLLTSNSLFTLDGTVPALIMQGSADDIVKPKVTERFVKQSCRAGAVIEYVTIRGKGHTGAITAGASQAVNWISARLRGSKARTTCR